MPETEAGGLGPRRERSTVPETEAGDEGRVLTLPNALSLVRLLCVPLFLWLLFGRHDRGAAAYLLGALGATDWVDGYVARRWHQVSTVGKVLDPAADRVLLVAGVIAILVDGAVPAWIGWATIVREVGISLAVLVLAAYLAVFLVAAATLIRQRDVT